MKQFIKEFILYTLVTAFIVGLCFAVAIATVWLTKNNPVLAILLIIPTSVLIVLLLDKILDKML